MFVTLPPLPNKPAFRLCRHLHDLLCPHLLPIFISIPVSILRVWVALDWRYDNLRFYEGRASGLKLDTIQGHHLSLAILRSIVAFPVVSVLPIPLPLPIHLRHLPRSLVRVRLPVLVGDHLLPSGGGLVTLLGGP